MWRTIYPKFVEDSLSLINDQNPEIQALATEINELLQILVDYVLADEESLEKLIKTIVPQLNHKHFSTVNLSMDWLKTLLKKQPQSLAKEADSILTTSLRMLRDLENKV